MPSRQLEGKRLSLITAAGVASESELAQLEEQRIAASELMREQAQLGREIAAALEGRVSEEDVATEPTWVPLRKMDQMNMFPRYLLGLVNHCELRRQLLGLH